MALVSYYYQLDHIYAPSLKSVGDLKKAFEAKSNSRRDWHKITLSGDSYLKTNIYTKQRKGYQQFWCNYAVLQHIFHLYLYAC